MQNLINKYDKDGDLSYFNPISGDCRICRQSPDFVHIIILE